MILLQLIHLLLQQHLHLIHHHLNRLINHQLQHLILFEALHLILMGQDQNLELLSDRFFPLSSMSAVASFIPSKPKNIKSTLSHPEWFKAMQEEVEALHANQTCVLVPRTLKMNVVGSRWIFKPKLNPDGSLER